MLSGLVDCSGLSAVVLDARPQGVAFVFLALSKSEKVVSVMGDVTVICAGAFLKVWVAAIVSPYIQRLFEMLNALSWLCAIFKFVIF